jgi:hypothetical protein
MIYNQYSGVPKTEMPKNVTLLGEIRLIHMCGMEQYKVYSDTPNNPEDIAHFEKELKLQKKINDQELPIWM